MSQIANLAPAGSSPAGDIVGPASSTDSAMALWDGTTGKLLKDSSTLIVEGTGSAIGAVTSDVVTYDLGSSAKAFHLESMIVGFESTTPASARYVVNAIVMTDGATATLVGTADTDSDESAALSTGDATIVVSGNNAIVRTTGVAGLTTNYRASTKIIGVS